MLSQAVVRACTQYTNRSTGLHYLVRSDLLVLNDVNKVVFLLINTHHIRHANLPVCPLPEVYSRFVKMLKVGGMAFDNMSYA